MWSDEPLLIDSTLSRCFLSFICSSTLFPSMFSQQTSQKKFFDVLEGAGFSDWSFSSVQYAEKAVSHSSRKIIKKVFYSKIEIMFQNKFVKTIRFAHPNSLPYFHPVWAREFSGVLIHLKRHLFAAHHLCFHRG